MVLFINLVVLTLLNKWGDHKNLVETDRTLLVSQRHKYTWFIMGLSIFHISLLDKYISFSFRQYFSIWKVSSSQPDDSFLKVFLPCLQFPWLKLYSTSNQSPKSTPWTFLDRMLQDMMGSMRLNFLLTIHCYLLNLKLVILFPYLVSFWLQTSDPSQHSALPLKCSCLWLFFLLLSTSCFTIFSARSCFFWNFTANFIQACNTSSPVLVQHMDLVSLFSLILHLPAPPTNLHPIQTRSKSGILKPKLFAASTHPLLMMYSLLFPQF